MLSWRGSIPGNSIISFLAPTSLGSDARDQHTVNFWQEGVLVLQNSSRVWLRKSSSAVVVRSLSWLFVTTWTAAHQASLPFTIFQSLLKPMSIESVMLSNHLILCRPLLLLPWIIPSIRVFSKESALHIRWHSVGASASVLPVSIQGWFPLGWADLISLLEIISRKLPLATEEEVKVLDFILWVNSYFSILFEYFPLCIF